MVRAGFGRAALADYSRNRKTGGRGLGLAIAKGIVKAHGGSLELESALGVGTRAAVEPPARCLVRPQ